MKELNWHQLANEFQPTTDAVIDGKPYLATSERMIHKVSPVDGRSLPDVAICSAKDVDFAVASARQAFEQGHWRSQTPEQRKAILYRFADLVEQKSTELALMDCLEMGKSVENLVNDDIPTCAASLRWFAESIDKLNGHTTPLREGSLGTVTYEPLGVVGAIIPWNYPLIMAAWKIAPALAMGNSVVLKPAEESVYSALLLAQLALEAGLPEGVLNVVPGDAETGKALALHMDVDGIFFTGSSEVGKKIMQYAGQSNLKRIGLECSGKSPLLVMEQSRQLPFAAKTLARHLFFNQGQICSAASRLIIHNSLWDQFLPLLLEQAEVYQPKDPLDLNSRVGAMFSQKHLTCVQQKVDAAIAQGAELIVGGKALAPVAGGAYYAPTILAGVTNEMAIAKQEIFGPVLSVIAVGSEEEAIAVANDTEFGLAAGVFTDDFTQAHRVARQLRAGTVHVNSWGEDDAAAPFGGIKQSGMGKDKSLWALKQYANLKNTWFKFG